MTGEESERIQIVSKSFRETGTLTARTEEQRAFRGRSERVFRILQDRLPKELALADITEMPAANRYLTERFLPVDNRRFAVPAAETGTVFMSWIGTNLASILCVQEDRVVAKYNTVHDQGKRFQLPPDPYRFHDIKVTVEVHAYPDASLAVFHGPPGLARLPLQHPLGRRHYEVTESREARHAEG